MTHSEPDPAFLLPLPLPLPKLPPPPRALQLRSVAEWTRRSAGGRARIPPTLYLYCSGLLLRVICMLVIRVVLAGYILSCSDVHAGMHVCTQTNVSLIARLDLVSYI